MENKLEMLSNEFLRKNNIVHLKIVMDKEYENQIARYDCQNECIIIYETVLLHNYLMTVNQYDFDHFLTFLLAHEVGHSLDPTFKEKFNKSQQVRLEMENLSDKINESPLLNDIEILISKFEENKEITIHTEKEAWERGYPFVPQELKKQYDQFNEENMERYQKQFQIISEELHRVREIIEGNQNEKKIEKI